MEYLFETERLRFRESTPADAEAMYELNSDPEVVQYTGDLPFASVDAAREFLENYVAVYRKWNRGRWIAELKSSGEIIGWSGLKVLEKENVTDVGYRLYKRHWGNGYATEAARATIDYGFNVLNLDRIVAHARKENVASLRVLEKCGMKIIGEGKDCGGDIFVFELSKTAASK
jgi:[ribosomal protein S5]-alanine N-acetyltransferase